MRNTPCVFQFRSSLIRSAQMCRRSLSASLRLAGAAERAARAATNAAVNGVGPACRRGPARAVRRTRLVPSLSSSRSSGSCSANMLKVSLARRQELLRGAGRHLRLQRPPNPPLAPKAPQPADPRHTSAAGGGLRLRRAAPVPAADGGGVSAEICGARGGLVDAERDDELGRPTRLPVAGSTPLPAVHFPLYFFDQGLDGNGLTAQVFVCRS